MKKNENKTKEGKRRVHGNMHVLNDELRERLKKESYETGQTRSEIVRDALYQYFGMKPKA